MLEEANLSVGQVAKRKGINFTFLRTGGFNQKPA